MLFLRSPAGLRASALGNYKYRATARFSRSAESWKPPGRGATSTGHPACYGTAEAIGRPRGSAQNDETCPAVVRRSHRTHADFRSLRVQPSSADTAAGGIQAGPDTT